MNRARIYLYVACVAILVIAVEATATQEGIGVAGVLVASAGLTFMLGMAVADRRDRTTSLEARIEILREFACCGCGHKLGRHREHQGTGLGCLDCNCARVHRPAKREPYMGRG